MADDSPVLTARKHIAQLVKRLRKPPQSRHANLPLIRVSDHPMQFERHVFICGLHRSGTTLLENHLRSHFAVAALEAPVPENEGQHLQDVYPAGNRYGGAGKFAFAPEMRLPVPTPQEADRARQRLLACWTPWVSEPADVLLEKSPPNLTKIAWLRAVFPGARFVIMTRDPRAVSAATLKWAKTSLDDLVAHWNVAHRIAIEDESSDCIRLRYEDYCEDADQHLVRLGQFLELRPRDAATGGDPRFAEVANQNGRYLEQFGSRSLGTGSWTEFGYDI
ncbi:MAG: sulfotransferase [Novosphingobium sp.]|nr:sulfotransferase [Novosphingobium sp.]